MPWLAVAISAAFQEGRGWKSRRRWPLIGNWLLDGKVLNWKPKLSLRCQSQRWIQGDELVSIATWLFREASVFFCRFFELRHLEICMLLEVRYLKSNDGLSFADIQLMYPCYQRKLRVQGTVLCFRFRGRWWCKRFQPQLTNAITGLYTAVTKKWTR